MLPSHDTTASAHSKPLWAIGLITFCIVTAGPADVLAAGLAKSDWPTYGGNAAHSKVSPAKPGPLTLFMRADPDLSRMYQTNSSPVVTKDTVYAILDDSASGPPELVAYDVHGRLKWRVPMPNYNASRQSRQVATTTSGATDTSRGAHNPTVLDDGTIVVGWQSNTANQKGITAFYPNGGIAYTGGCFQSNGTNNFLITPDSAGRMFWISNEGAVGLIACNPDGTPLWAIGPASNKTILATGQPGTDPVGVRGYGVAIDHNDTVYWQTSDGTHATRPTDGAPVWLNDNKSTIRYNNEQVSPDGRWLASAGSPALVALIDTLSGQTRWRYGLGTSFGTFAFGLGDRLYVSANARSVNRTGLMDSAGIPINPPVSVGAYAGKVCAIEVSTGKDIWCTPTPGHLQQAGMVVDSSNSVYFCDIAEGSFDGLDANGNSAFKYRDPKITGGSANVGDNSCWDVPAMSDDGNLYFEDNYLYGFRPWTLSVSVYRRPSGSNTAITFTVRSSMLRRDPQDGVTSDNHMQIRLDGGNIIPLNYARQDGDSSVWEGTLSIPASEDLARLHIKGTIEAIAYHTQGAQVTHFADLPQGFNNTGAVQALDLSTADRLPGQSAQSFSSSTSSQSWFDAAFAWIRGAARSAWSSALVTYASIQDFVMR